MYFHLSPAKWFSYRILQNVLRWATCLGKSLWTLCFLAFFSCKSWLIILFIVATDVSKHFAIDFYVGGFSLVTSAFTLETFETVRTFFGYSFGVFFPCRNIDWRFFNSPMNNVAYFALRNFNTMHFTTFLNSGMRIVLFGKRKNISFNPQLVYIRHFERRINFRVADDISHSK